MFKHEKRKFLADSKIQSFYILLYFGWHNVSLKYYNLDFIGLLLLKNLWNNVYAKLSYLSAGILNDKSAFFSGHRYLLKVRLIPINC